jgi:hypothetical protein
MSRIAVCLLALIACSSSSPAKPDAPIPCNATTCAAGCCDDQGRCQSGFEFPGSANPNVWCSATAGGACFTCANQQQADGFHGCGRDPHTMMGRCCLETGTLTGTCQ